MDRRVTMGAALLVLATAGGAMAQDMGACGQLSMLTQTLREPLRTGFDQRSARLDIPRSEARYLEFSLDGAQPVFLRTENAGGGDPMLALFDSAGATVAWDDDGAGDLNSLLRLDLDSGAYCAQVRLHGAEPVSATVGLVLSSDGTGFPPPPPGEGPMPCDTAALQGDLGVLSAGRLPTSLSGRVSADNGQVAWRLTLTEETALLIDAVSNDIDTVLTLYDTAGDPAYENDDHPDASGANSRLAEALPAGEWCLAVRPYDVSSTGNVLVVMSAPGPDVELGGGAFFGDGGGFGGPATGGCGDLSALPVLAEGLTSGFSPWIWDYFVEENGRADFRLSLMEGMSVQIDAGSDELDTVLAVYDADGNFLFENDDHPDVIGTNSRLVERLEAGDYCVSVRGFAGSGGDFAVSVALPGEGPDLGGPADGGGMDGNVDPLVCSSPTTVDLAAGLAPGFTAISQPGLVDNSGPADFILSVSEAVELQLDAASITIDTVMTLYDLDGAFLDENDDDFEAGGTNSRIVTTLVPGDYCVRVRGFGGDTGPFTIAVAAPGSAGPQDGGGAQIPADRDVLELPETFEDLGALAGEALQSQGVSRDQVLWASFVMDADGAVAVQGVSMTSDYVLVLLDESGIEIVAEPSSGDIATARIETDLPAGRYFVAMDNGWDDGVLHLRQITVQRP
jgi:hypothetical protein